jgi:DNA-directed RNA polymerase subunit M/transcription elongation factor TFIIS
MVIYATVLQPKNTKRNASIPEKSLSDGKPSPELAGTILRRAKAPEYIGTWKWRLITVHLYGYKTGKADTENKHELPPPHDTILLFGESILFATNNDATGKSQFINFGSADYTKFYNEVLGGFDDIGSEDSATEDEVSDLASEDEDDIETDVESEKSEEEVDVEEEEEEVLPPRRIVPKAPAKPSKRNLKKMPIWYSLPELSSEGHEMYPTRTNTLQFIQKRLTNLTNEMGADLEKGIYLHCLNEGKLKKLRRVWENPEFLALYNITAKRVISNLDTNSYVSNSRLYERLKEGEFKPCDIAAMTFQELFPEKWKELEEHAMKREVKMLEVDKSMATDMFKCSRCQKRQTTYYEMQTRSADEPMTQFIRCLNCGKQWRQ